MKKLEFKILIAANRKKVWETMLNPVTYKKWVNVSWPGSYYEGDWKQGEDLRFISPGRGGTMAHLVECKLYEYILAKHIAVINADGSLDKESKIAQGWIGTTESYTFSEQNGETTLTTEVNITPEWAQMFNDGWPQALAALKDLCEKEKVLSA